MQKAIKAPLFFFRSCEYSVHLRFSKLFTVFLEKKLSFTKIALCIPLFHFLWVHRKWLFYAHWFKSKRKEQNSQGNRNCDSNSTMLISSEILCIRSNKCKFEVLRWQVNRLKNNNNNKTIQSHYSSNILLWFKIYRNFPLHLSTKSLGVCFNF